MSGFWKQLRGPAAAEEPGSASQQKAEVIRPPDGSPRLFLEAVLVREAYNTLTANVLSGAATLVAADALCTLPSKPSRCCSCSHDVQAHSLLLPELL